MVTIPSKEICQLVDPEQFIQLPNSEQVNMLDDWEAKVAPVRSVAKPTSSAVLSKKSPSPISNKNSRCLGMKDDGSRCKIMSHYANVQPFSPAGYCEYHVDDKFKHPDDTYAPDPYPSSSSSSSSEKKKSPAKAAKAKSATAKKSTACRCLGIKNDGKQCGIMSYYKTGTPFNETGYCTYHSDEKFKSTNEVEDSSISSSSPNVKKRKIQTPSEYYSFASQPILKGVATPLGAYSNYVSRPISPPSKGNYYNYNNKEITNEESVVKISPSPKKVGKSDTNKRIKMADCIDLTFD